MATTNNLTKQNKQAFSTFIAQDSIKKLMSTSLGENKKAMEKFTANIVSVVSANPTLQECTPASIISAGLMANSLNLNMNQQLGYFYLVPFNNKKANTKTAQAMIGYKGYLQLALRSQQYKKINTMAVKDGEIKVNDPFNEEFVAEIIPNYEEREKAKTVGYYAMFEDINGFKKFMYMSKEEMMAYANKYSMAFDKNKYKLFVNGKVSQKDAWQYSSYWYQNFDRMACKTVLKQLLSQWGTLTEELQKAINYEQEIETKESVSMFEDINEIQDVKKEQIDTKDLKEIEDSFENVDDDGVITDPELIAQEEEQELPFE